MWPFRRQADVEEVQSVAVPGSCGERGKRYRVHWVWPEKNETGENAFLPVAMHEDSPTISLNADYLGPLCPHELHMLSGKDRGHDLSMQWQITVTEQ